MASRKARRAKLELHSGSRRVVFLLRRLLVQYPLVVVKRLKRFDVHSEDVFLDVVRESFELVQRVRARWDGEYLIEFLKGECFRLRDEKQDEDESNDVPASVPAERSLRCEGNKETGESDGNNEVAENMLSARPIIDVCKGIENVQEP